mmetsp:Transcript_9114/g.22319  ORF Transcript_9114/g.22319 Transcript_9114/m.22319 type:complete len:219 (+) Transcript_9114:4389-5045(+)
MKDSKSLSAPCTLSALLRVYGTAASLSNCVRTRNAFVDAESLEEEEEYSSKRDRTRSAGNLSCLLPSSSELWKSRIKDDMLSNSFAGIRPLSTDNCSSISNIGNEGSVTAKAKSSIAISTSPRPKANPAIAPFNSSIAARRTKWGRFAFAGLVDAPHPSILMFPSKTVVEATFSGLSSTRVANKSPGLNAAPSFAFHSTTPASSTFKGINIFMTSISA